MSLQAVYSITQVHFFFFSAYSQKEKLISQIVNDELLIKLLQKQNLYIRIPYENTSKIILTPPHGIESAAQLKSFIEILKSIEVKIKSNELSRNY